MPAGFVSVACELTATMRPPSAIRGVSAAIVRTAARRFASSMRDQSSGDERVLDVGCGRGLMLIGAAKRLTTGRATGIDIWQAEDLSGNRPEATLENAEREGVRERIEVKTADMRKLPFDDGSFDVVVSCAAIHNLYEAGDRAQAIREVSRVLGPGGRAVIDDIRHLGEYAKTFGEEGFDVRRSGSRIVSAFLAILTFGSLRPATVIATRSASAPGR